MVMTEEQKEIIAEISRHYPDGLIARHAAAKNEKQANLLGDGLAAFIAREVLETTESLEDDDVLLAALGAMERALVELEKVTGTLRDMASEQAKLYK